MLPDVAVALGPGQRRQRLHQVHHVGVQRRPLGQRASSRVQRVRQLGQQAALHRPGQLQQAAVSPDLGRPGRWPPTRPWCPRPTPRPAAPSTPAASATPRSPGRCPGSRCRSRPADPVQLQQPQPVEQLGAAPVDRPAQVEVPVPRVGPPAGPAGVRQVRIRSASSGTVGTRSLTEPRAWPTTRCSVTKPTARSSPSQSTARVASVTSVRPASGRDRRLARVSASRTASMTWALETGRSRSRSARATLVSQRVIGLVGRGPQVVVPARRGDPGAVPAGAGQPLVRSTAPRSASPCAWGSRAASPRRRWPAAAARSAPARARRRRPRRPAAARA